MATAQLSSPSELLRRAWRRFSSRWTTAVLISVLMSFVVSILLMLMSGSVLVAGPTLSLTTVTSVLFIWMLVVVFLGAYAGTMLMVLLSDEKPISLGQVMTRANKLYWPVFTTGLLTGLIILGGSVFLIIPGLVLSIYLVLTQIVVVVEGKRGMAAIRRSRGLIDGQLGQTFWRLFVLGFAIVLVNMIVTGLLRILSINDPNGVASSLISLVSSPFTTAYIIELYHDRRGENASAKENWLYKLLAVVGGLVIAGCLAFGLFFARAMNGTFHSEWQKTLEDAGVIKYSETSSNWDWNWSYDSTNTD